MKSNNQIIISPEFSDLFSHSTEKEELEHESKMIMFRFLSEFEKLFANNLPKKKDIAESLNTSPSFITQLFRGDKLINLLSLAKLQKAFGFQYEIKAVKVTQDYKQEVIEDYGCYTHLNSDQSFLGFYKNITLPDYNNNPVVLPYISKNAI